MNIAAITRYKHGNIFKLLKKLGWSQSELARRTGFSTSTIGYIINLYRRPDEAQANAIQRAFGEAGEYLDVLEEWPEAFHLDKGFRREEIAEIPVGNMLYSKEMMALEFEPTAAPKGLVDSLEVAMADLDPREKKVIEGFMDGHSLAETGKKVKVCVERCRQIQMKAFRKLRHPSRITKLDHDWADQEIENERRRAAEYAKEEKERVERDIQDAEERREKERIRQEGFADQLRAARKAQAEMFDPARRILYCSYYPGPQQNYVLSVTGEVMLSGAETVLKFIREFIDPDFHGPWANYSLSYD